MKVFKLFFVLIWLLAPFFILSDNVCAEKVNREFIEGRMKVHMYFIQQQLNSFEDLLHIGPVATVDLRVTVGDSSSSYDKYKVCAFFLVENEGRESLSPFACHVHCWSPNKPNCEQHNQNRYDLLANKGDIALEYEYAKTQCFVSVPIFVFSCKLDVGEVTRNEMCSSSDCHPIPKNTEPETDWRVTFMVYSENYEKKDFCE